MLYSENAVRTAPWYMMLTRRKKRMSVRAKMQKDAQPSAAGLRQASASQSERARVLGSQQYLREVRGAKKKNSWACTNRLHSSRNSVAQKTAAVERVSPVERPGEVALALSVCPDSWAGGGIR